MPMWVHGTTARPPTAAMGQTRKISDSVHRVCFPLGSSPLIQRTGNARSGARRVVRALVGSNFTFLRHTLIVEFRQMVLSCCHADVGAWHNRSAADGCNGSNSENLRLSTSGLLPPREQSAYTKNWECKKWRSTGREGFGGVEFHFSTTHPHC